MPGTYEITVEVANRDWKYRRVFLDNLHEAAEYGLVMAEELNGRLIRIERLPT